MNFEKDNVKGWDPDLKEGQSLLYLGTPSYTTCPYDQYARMMADDAKIAFKRSRIPTEVHCCHRRLASVGWGSGPGGSVRLGDDMIPPDVQVVVATVDLERARQAWEDYTGRKFLPKPFSVVGRLWYNKEADNPYSVSGGAWEQGGTWPKVIVNALAIARAIGRGTGRLEAYAGRKGIELETSQA